MSNALQARLLDGWAEPAALFLRNEALGSHAFFLDAGVGATSGWSYLGIGSAASVDDILAIDMTVRSADPWVAGPFRGGWICWLAYDEAAAAAGAHAVVERGSSRALLATRFLAFDHATRQVWAVADDADIDEFSGKSASRIAVDGDEAIVESPEASVAIARKTAEQYAVDIERCRGAIRQGDAYQLCLTTRFTVPGEHDAAAVFLRLRQQTPSHHAAYIRAGDTALVSASPEQFLTVTEGVVSTKPIKGTRPRGATPAEDRRLADELLASEKERAENVMIVDLMRNDLSRVCVPGSVRVPALFTVESYRAVHQLVSTVTGQLRGGTTFGELVAATFPAGSMTGAPKLSAMTILNGIEGAARGVYAGCFGWVSSDGSADLAMVIRSIVVESQQAYVGAGGGITWGSVAADEVAEVAIKARAPLAALGARVPEGWEQER